MSSEIVGVVLEASETFGVAGVCSVFSFCYEAGTVLFGCRFFCFLGLVWAFFWFCCLVDCCWSQQCCNLSLVAFVLALFAFAYRLYFSYKLVIYISRDRKSVV